MKNNKNELIVSEVIKIFKEFSITEEGMDNEKVKKILKDIDIASAVQKLERAVAGRKIKIISKNGDEEKAIEIQNRFSSIKFNRIINHLITARYFGYSCFEIIYNEDFTINTLIPIYYDYVIYDTRSKEWKIKIRNKEIVLNREKFLLAIHKWNPAKVTGTSIFECCELSFLNKELFNKQLRNIAEKYGDLIVIYPYDINMDDKDREKLKKSIDNIKGASSIGAPVDFNENFDLKKVIDFIKLSDLDPRIYTELENREKEKLIQNILGSTLTMNNGDGKGSYSLGQVHQDGFEQVVEEICKFVSDSLYQLLETDSIFFGYNSKEFEFVVEKIYTEADKIEQEKEKEGLKSIKLDNIQKLINAGYGLDTEYISNYLGIDKKYLSEKSVKLLGEFSYTPENKLFSTIEAQKKFEKYLEKKMDKFTESVEKQIIEQLDNIKEDGEFIFNIDYSELEDDLILSQIRAYTTAKTVTLGLKTKEFDPFNMPFQEAIKSFMDKTPILYETIEKISEEIRSNCFWLKKSTDLEMTSKLFENMKKNLENGGTLKQWLKDSKDVIEKLGLGKQGYYLENVYRTNMFSQYSIGNYKQLDEMKKEYPYWQYQAIEDNGTTPICRSLNGKVYRADDPFWSIYYPPNHYQCRSTVICLSKEDMKEYGYTLSKYDDTMSGEELGSFKGNPAKTYWKNMEKRANEKQGVFVWGKDY